MSTRNVFKQLATMEDLAQGVGQVNQRRGKTDYSLGKVDVPYAVESVEDLQRLDVSKFTRANLYSSTTEFQAYIYDETRTDGILPLVGAGSWVISSGGDARYQKKVSTVAEVATGKFKVGDVIELSDRAYGKFEVVDGGTPNGFDILDAGNGNTAVLQFNGQVDVDWFGAKGDWDGTQGVDNTDTFNYVGDNYQNILISNGVYAHTGTLKMMSSNDRYITYSQTASTHHIGSGVATQWGRDDNSAIYNCKLINPTITGNNSTTDGMVFVAFSHGYVETPNVRDVSGAGIRCLWVIECVFNAYNISSNEGPFNVVPTYGVRIGETASGLYSVGCTFINATIEGVSSDGVWIEHGSLNSFNGGTSEANGSGVTINSGCYDNKFEGFWLEANSSFDINDGGSRTIVENCYMGSNAPTNPNMIASGSALQVSGGWCRYINLSSASSDTRLTSVTFPDNPSVGIKGTGTKQIIGCLKADSNGEISGFFYDEMGASGQFTPTLQGSATAGNHTYSVQNASWYRIGNVVHYSIDLSITIKDVAMSGNVIVGPLPFPSKNIGSNQASAIGYYSLVTLPGGRDNLTAEVLNNNVYIQLWACLSTGGGAQLVDSSGITNSTRIKLSGSYLVG